MQCGSDRGAGEESGNAGRSVRDPGHRCMHNVDAGAMAALVRRKGRVGIRGVGGCSRYKSWAAAPRPTDGRSSAMHVRAIREVQARPRDRRGCVGGTREAQRPG